MGSCSDGGKSRHSCKCKSRFPSSTIQSESEDAFEDYHDGDRGSEDHVQRARGKRTARINMFTASKKTKSVNQP